MTEFRGVIQMQLDTLLGELRRQQETRCRELMHSARSQASGLLKRSRRQLHQRGREALDEERRRRESDLQQARNRLRAQESERVQLLYAELLRQAWPLLVEQLQRRWSEMTHRKAWCEKLLGEAQNTLEPVTWEIEHPAEWSDEDTRWLAGAMRERGLPPATLHCEPASRGGLKIIAGSACIDGTIDGLLARRRRVEARLLAAWEMRATGDRHD